jgi:mannose-1-phosphate guanylyltransferase
MIPIGEKQKPVLEYIIRLLAFNEIKDIVLLVGYKYNQISNYFSSGNRFGVNIEYILDKPGLTGSANALLNAYDKKSIEKKDHLIIYYGDILSNINLREMLDQHKDSEASATVALSKNYRVRVGTARVRDGVLINFNEKPMLKQPVSIGILILNGGLLEDLTLVSEKENKKKFDIMGDVIPYLIESGQQVNAYISDCFWYDLGSLERYELFENGKLDNFLNFLFP